MNVKVISITRGLGDLQHLTGEDLIVYTARVSNPSNQNNVETSEKLLNYLIKNKHWSPLDMVDMTVEVKTSRAVTAQIARHWSHRFQEFSQRYAQVVEFEEVELRKQGATNRQSSEEVFDPQIFNVFDITNDSAFASHVIREHIANAETLYKELIQAGVAKECARMVLPMCTQSTIYMKASARSWFHYLEQRLDKHAQLEHRQVALEILRSFQQYFPNLAKLLKYE